MITDTRILGRTPFLAVAFEAIVYLAALLALAATMIELPWSWISPLVLAFTGLAIARELRGHGSGYFFFLRLLLIFVPLVQMSILGPTKGFDVLSHTQRLFDSYGRQAIVLLVTFYLLMDVSRVIFGVERRFAHMERKLLQNLTLSISPWGQTLLGILSLVALYIYQPSIPGIAYSDMTHNLLPGASWNYICFLSFAALLLTRHKLIFARFVVWLVPAWLLLHYARVELLGMMILYLVYKRAHSRRFSYLELGLAALLISVFIVIGVIRNEPSLEALGSVSVSEVVGNRTIQDTTHNLLAALAYYETKGSLNTVLITLEYIPPSYFVGERTMNAETLLQGVIGTHFGTHWIGEIYLNAGAVGVVIGALLTSVLVPAMVFFAQLLRDRTLTALLTFHIFLSLPRFCWYGVIYLIKPILFVMPIIWLVAWSASRSTRAGND